MVPTMVDWANHKRVIILPRSGFFDGPLFRIPRSFRALCENHLGALLSIYLQAREAQQVRQGSSNLMAMLARGCGFWKLRVFREDFSFFADPLVHLTVPWLGEAVMSAGGAPASLPADPGPVTPNVPMSDGASGVGGAPASQPLAPSGGALRLGR